MQIYTATVMNATVTSAMHHTADFHMSLEKMAKDTFGKVVKESRRVATGVAPSDMADANTQKIMKRTSRALAPIAAATVAQITVNRLYKKELNKLQKMETNLANQTFNGVGGIQAINKEFNDVGIGIKSLHTPEGKAADLLGKNMPINITSSVAAYQVTEFDINGLLGEIKVARTSNGQYKITQKAINPSFKNTTGKMYTRRTMGFQRHGEKIRFSNLGSKSGGGVSQAGSIVNMYRYYKKMCKITGHTANQALSGHMEKIAKQAKKVDRLKGTYRHLANPRKFARAGMSLALSVYGNSEAGEGVQLAQNTVTGTRVIGRTVKNPVINTGSNVLRTAEHTVRTIQIYRSSANVQGATRLTRLRNARKMATGRMKIQKVRLRDITKRNPMIEKFESTVASNLRMKSAQFLSKSANPYAQYQAKMQLAKATLRNGYGDPLGKEAEKAVKKALKDELKDNVRLNKATKKAEKRAAKGKKAPGKKKSSDTTKKSAKKALKKVAKIVGDKVKETAIYKATEAIRQKIAEAVAKLLDAVGDFLAAAWEVILVILAIIVVLCIIVQLFLVGYEYGHEISRQMSIFSLSSTNDFRDRAKIFMDSVHESHNKMLVTLRDMQAGYDTADIEYPTGTQENYKELFCAMNVMAQYDSTQLERSDYQDMADILYDKTHIITTFPYDYYDMDGTLRHACHIYVDIQRDEVLAYACMDGNVIERANRSGAVVSTGRVVNSDWMNVVKELKKRIANTGVLYYNETRGHTQHVNITINGVSYDIRPDCSGYVSACLQVYGSFPKGRAWGSATFRDATSIRGFTKMNFTSWSNLCEGDILVINRGREHHVEIYSHDANGRHYVYNCGSDSSVANPGTSASSHSSYQYVFRPYDPGSGEMFTPEDEAPSVEVPTEGGGTETIELITSNTIDIVFNPETGNEDGYESKLVSDIESEILPGGFFNGRRYFTTYKSHALTATSADASSIDFVRYIFAKHGVRLSFEMEDAMKLGDPVTSVDELKIGDIVFYVPHTEDTDKIAAVKPINELGLYAQTSVEGIEDPRETLIESAIPMIYVGNGQVVAYSRNALASKINYESSAPLIQKYSLSALDTTRILKMTRRNGFTKNPVYGYTKYFDGWTDDNICNFIKLLYDPCWEVGKYTVHTSSDDLEVDYSWYSEEYFTGNDVYWTGEHTDIFLSEMIQLLIKWYDQYGILPSTGYTHAYVVSNNRSTEESLAHNNIFELTTSGEIAANVDKYSYTATGKPKVKIYKYTSFSSYLSCLSQLYSIMNNTGYGGAVPTNSGAYRNFTSQLNAYTSLNFLDADIRSKMMTRYNEVKDVLDNADAIAVTRKGKIDTVKSKAASARSINSLSNTENDLSTYRGQVARYNALLNAYNDLLSYLNDTSSSTNITDALLEQTKSDLNSYYDKLKTVYNYGSSHPKVDHYESYCPGHTVTNPRTGLTGTYYHESGCQSRPVYENWGSFSLSRP